MWRNKSGRFIAGWMSSVLFSIITTTLALDFIAKHPTAHFTQHASETAGLIAIVHLVTLILHEVTSLFPESQIHRCVANISLNNQLYGTILFCLWIGVSETPPLQLHSILELYVVGRVVFSVGYLIGTAVNMQYLRSFGFGLTVASLLAVTVHRFGIDLIANFNL